MKYYFLLVIISLFTPYIASSQESDVNEAAQSSNEFCFDLLKTAHKSGENDAFSPFSISAAFAMTYDGTAWRTKRDIRETMNFPFRRSKNHKLWTDVLNYFKQLKNNVFKTANAVWAQEKYGFVEDYMEGLKDFDAKTMYVDFKDAVEREKGRKEMNKWVEEKTRGKVKKLIRKGNIDHLTRMVLINAIHFKADWKTAFDEELTSERYFNLSSGEKTKVEFMKKKKTEIPFTENKTFKMIELPYSSDIASMYFILPSQNKSVDDVIESLSPEKFNQSINQLEPVKINAAIPKFKLKARYEMKNTLKEMGMIAPFSNYANFRPMNGKRNLLIDDVIHQAVVEIDETGTEAAASTAIVVREKSAPKIPSFIADEPFVFIIKEHKKDFILFSGVVENPSN